MCVFLISFIEDFAPSGFTHHAWLDDANFDDRLKTFNSDDNSYVIKG